MKKVLPFIIFILIVSCGKSSSDKSCKTMSCEVNEFSLSTTPEGAVPPGALNFAVHLTLLNFGVTDQEKIENAAELVKRVIMSQEFKDEVVNYTYNGRKSFTDNNGLTNLQIYDRIIIAAEKNYPVKNFALDAELELYYEDSSTVGYTYPNNPRIWMNTKYFNQYTPYQVAGNLTHEWLHKMGFNHDVEPTASRSYSVPYAVGYLVRRLASELHPGLY